jgi:hypothetical protein
MSGEYRYFAELRECSSTARTARHERHVSLGTSISENLAVRHPELFFVSRDAGGYSDQATHAICRDRVQDAVIDVGLDVETSRSRRRTHCNTGIAQALAVRYLCTLVLGY